MLTAYGADVDLVTEPHPEGGWQQARRDRVMEILESDPDAWYPDQYNNPDNVDAYGVLQKSCQRNWARSTHSSARSAPEAIRPGWRGCCAKLNRDLQLIGVDTIGSTIFGQPAGPG